MIDLASGNSAAGNPLRCKIPPTRTADLYLYICRKRGNMWIRFPVSVDVSRAAMPYILNYKLRHLHSVNGSYTTLFLSHFRLGKFSIEHSGGMRLSGGHPVASASTKIRLYRFSKLMKLVLISRAALSSSEPFVEDEFRTRCK